MPANSPISPRLRKLLQKARSKPSVLNRYTSLPIALDILKRSRLTLLSPETWEDRNDAFYLERYREEMRLRSVLALCFAKRGETFHHWRIFSHGTSGVCIEFSAPAILAAIAGDKSFRSQDVEYHTILNLAIRKPDMEKWPFLKRKAFEDEKEFRIIYETKKEALRFKNLSIPLTSILKITLSPWLPDSVAQSTIEVIKAIDGCGELEVIRSTLIDNSGWRKIVQ